MMMLSYTSVRPEGDTDTATVVAPCRSKVVMLALAGCPGMPVRTRTTALAATKSAYRVTLLCEIVSMLKKL